MASYHFISAKVIVSVSEELLLLLLPPPPIPAVGMSEWTDEEREAMAASVVVVKRIWAHTCALSLSLSLPRVRALRPLSLSVVSVSVSPCGMALAPQARAGWLRQWCTLHSIF